MKKRLFSQKWIYSLIFSYILFFMLFLSDSLDNALQWTKYFIMKIWKKYPKWWKNLTDIFFTLFYGSYHSYCMWFSPISVSDVSFLSLPVFLSHFSLWNLDFLVNDWTCLPICIPIHTIRGVFRILKREVRARGARLFFSHPPHPPFSHTTLFAFLPYWNNFNFALTVEGTEQENLGGNFFAPPTPAGGCENTRGCKAPPEYAYAYYMSLFSYLHLSMYIFVCPKRSVALAVA